VRTSGWRNAPEWSLVAWGLPVNAVWEFAHSPLYTDWTSEWTYLLWTRLHCTAGDALILLGAFWVTAAVVRTRHWIGTRSRAGLLFVALGFAYTVWSERYNVGVRASWGYGPAMPVLLGVGLTPMLQWVLLPPLVLRLTGRGDH